MRDLVRNKMLRWEEQSETEYEMMIDKRKIERETEQTYNKCCNCEPSHWGVQSCCDCKVEESRAFDTTKENSRPHYVSWYHFFFFFFGKMKLWIFFMQWVELVISHGHIVFCISWLRVFNFFLYFNELFVEYLFICCCLA